MNISKLLSTLGILLFMVACSTAPHSKNQTNPDSSTTGRIVFPVFGERFMGKRANTYIGVELILKNQKTGQRHTSLMKFKDGKRIEYINKLTPGVYVIDEYREMVMGGFFPRQLKPSAEIVVAPGQTVLSPVLVHMRGHIYPSSGLGYIQDDDYWDRYR